MSINIPRPTKAFIGASWASLTIGVISYFYGLSNLEVGLSEKGYYLVLMLYGLFSVVSLQKTVRDRSQDIPVTQMYFLITWFAVISSIALMAVGLWNASFSLPEKGFYGMSYILSLFACVTVQKNVRDAKDFDVLEGNTKQVNNDGPWIRTVFSSKSKIDSTGEPVEEL